MGHIIDKEAYDREVANFLAALTEKTKKFYETQGFSRLTPPVFEIDKGRKFDKVVRNESNRRSVYCYIDKASGGLLKGDWRAVQDHRERGNIFNEDCLAGCDPYGLAYLTGPQYGWGF